MKKINMKRTIWSSILGILEILAGLSAVHGGYGLVFQNGLGIPTKFLAGSPFHDYMIPGLILLFVVGGANILAGIFMLFPRKWTLELNAIAGFSLMIWDFSEIYIMRHTNPLQLLYFSFGVVILVSTLLLQKYKRT